MMRKRTRPHRTFLVLAIIMIALLVVGLAAIFALATEPRILDYLLTADDSIPVNGTVEAYLNQTQTSAAATPRLAS